MELFNFVTLIYLVFFKLKIQKGIYICFKKNSTCFRFALNIQNIRKTKLLTTISIVIKNKIIVK